MAAYPYVTVPGHLREFMQHIQQAKVPDRVTLNYLKQSGFTSSNDRPIRDVLKFIGFLDSDYRPTDLWQEYRVKSKAPVVLAHALRNNYRELFDTFPDAHRKDTEALRNFFAAHSEVGDRTLKAMIRTFSTLAELADFSADRSGEAPDEPSETEREIATEVASMTKRGRGLTVNLNIEIGIPATDDAEIYEKFFAAMREYLLED